MQLDQPTKEQTVQAAQAEIARLRVQLGQGRDSEVNQQISRQVDLVRQEGVDAQELWQLCGSGDNWAYMRLKDGLQL